MPQISARVSDDLNGDIETFSDENSVAKSEAIRTLLERGLEYDRVENETAQLRDQLAAANQRIDVSNEIVEYIEEERSLQRQREERERRREEREQRRAEAGVLTRAKWCSPAATDGNEGTSENGSR